MEIPSAHRRQPYGSESGTKLAQSTMVYSKFSQKEQVSTTEASEKRLKLLKKQSKPPKREKLNRAERERIVEQMNDFISSINKACPSGWTKSPVRCCDYEADTGDIIRQIPDEEMLEILRRLGNRLPDIHRGLLTNGVIALR